MSIAEALKLALMLSIFLTVLALALRAKANDLLYLVRNWRLGLRALVALYVVVPLVAIAIAAAFDLKPAVKIALVALAFSPVPPLLPRKQVKAGASGSYITGLLVLASLCALVVTPLGIHAAAAFFGVDASVSTLSIARILGVGIAAPLALGLVASAALGERAGRMADPIARIANILFLVCVLGLLFKAWPGLLAVVGDGTALALGGMAVAGLIAGYALAGGAPQDRMALSFASAARHPGIAISIAASNFPDAKLAIAAILLYAIFNAIIGIVILQRMKRFNR